MLKKLFGQGYVKQGFSWSLYDFANSSYAIIVASFIFPVLYRDLVAGKEKGDFYWGLITGVSILLGALASPLVGAMADEDKRKKRKFVFFVSISAVATSLLYFSGPNTLLFSSLIFILANAFFELAQTLYDSFLSRVSPKHLWGKVSGFAWGLGYIGGVAAMLIFKPWYERGFEGANLNNYLLTFPLTALFFLVFSLPMFFWVKDSETAVKIRLHKLFYSGYTRIKNTFQNIVAHKNIFKFLLAFYFMNDAMATMFAFMPIFARTTIGMNFKDLTLILLGTQVLAFPAAWFSGWISDKVGQKPVVLLTVFGWFALTLMMAQSQTKTHFYILASLGALVMGSSQGAARAWLTKIVPEEKRSEFFGFNGFASKIAATTGPVIFGALSSFTGNQRYGVLAMLPFFVISFFIFLKVRED